MITSSKSRGRRLVVFLKVFFVNMNKLCFRNHRFIDVGVFLVGLSLEFGPLWANRIDDRPCARREDDNRLVVSLTELDVLYTFLETLLLIYNRLLMVVLWLSLSNEPRLVCIHVPTRVAAIVCHNEGLCLHHLLPRLESLVELVSLYSHLFVDRASS